jgi:glycosyltransferase involved in cell wall biosynthesis
MAGQSPNVLICVPCLMVGGTEMHTLMLAKALMTGGYQVTVCAYFESDPIARAEFQRNGVRVVLLSMARSNDRRNFRRMPALVAALVKVMQQIRPRVVHVQYMAPGIAPIVAARLAEVPTVVATVHVTANHYGNRRWLPRNIASRLCDVFLCVSKTAERSFFGESAEQFSPDLFDAGRRHFTIHNCVDLQRVDEVLAEPTPDSLRHWLGIDGRPVVGIVGRLHRFKGHDLLLEAMAMVRRRVDGAVLLCVGGGSDREKLQAEAARLGLAGSVIFTNQLAQGDVFRHMRLMDVVAMPSRVGLEGFGLAAAEAMAMGLPLVASSADALVEVVGEEDIAGMLVPPGDVTTLAAKIEMLLMNPTRRSELGAAARARVEDQFSLALFTRRHLELYEALCGSERASIAIATPNVGALA